MWQARGDGAKRDEASKTGRGNDGCDRHGGKEQSGVGQALMEEQRGMRQAMRAGAKRDGTSKGWRGTEGCGTQ